MVIISNEPVDHLPYIDVDITPQERQRVEQLIQNERVHDPPGLHFRVADLVPLTLNLALMHDVQKFEDDDARNEDDDDDYHILPTGITMERYSEFSGNYKEMYTALSYSVLRERSSSVMAQNSVQLQDAQQQHVASISEVDKLYLDEIERKRKQVDETNDARKRRQVEFEPVAAYLELRWQEGIRSMVDLGIHSAQQQL